MTATTEHLRSELERLFELDDMMALARDLLGLRPDDVGGTAGKGSFARALVDRCVASPMTLRHGRGERPEPESRGDSTSGTPMRGEPPDPRNG